MRFKTDKEWPHGYLPDYLRIVEELGPAAVVCEIGVYYGASLEMWKELFPQGKIIGVDIDAHCLWPEGTYPVVHNQASPGIRQAVEVVAPDGCDLIVDDASHIAKLTEVTFESLWPLIRSGGYYVIEDWAEPSTIGDLGAWVPELIGTLRADAKSVTYTAEGLVILQRR